MLFDTFVSKLLKHFVFQCFLNIVIFEQMTVQDAFLIQLEPIWAPKRVPRGAQDEPKTDPRRVQNRVQNRIEKMIESIQSNFVKKNVFDRLVFSWGGLGGRSRFFSFQKFAKANFLKWCSGGVWGRRSPPRNLRYPCFAPRGDLGGFAPQESPLPVPCLRSGRALPPTFFIRIFSRGWLGF